MNLIKSAVRTSAQLKPPHFGCNTSNPFQGKPSSAHQPYQPHNLKTPIGWTSFSKSATDAPSTASLFIQRPWLSQL